ncbi:MAG: exo-alpha-sialidase [candidate division Zixibacteria bacterium]
MNNTPFLLKISIFVILMYSGSPAQFSPVSIQRINTDNGSNNQTGANIHYTDQGEIVITWGDKRSSHSLFSGYMRISTDNGLSFGDEILINDIDGYIRAGGEEKIELTDNTNGDLVFAWTDMRNGNSNGDIYGRIGYADNSFSHVFRYNDDQTEFYDLLPHINRVGSSDTLMAAWLDSRECQWYCPEIRASRSTDGGESWSANIRADIQGEDDEPCDCCHPWIIAGSDGQILVAFRNNLDNIRDIYVARSNESFTEFSPPVRASFGAWEIPACPSTGPVMIQHSSGVWVCAYTDGRNGTYRIYTSRSTDDALTFQDELIIDDNGQTQNFPDLIELNDGRIMIAYQHINDDFEEVRIMAALSEDAGYSWGEVFEISDSEISAKSNVGLAKDDIGNILAVWVDNRRDVGDIYFAVLSEATGIENGSGIKPESFFSLSSYPNPFNATARITFSLPVPREITLKVYDLMGREVRTLVDDFRDAGIHHVSFDASDLAGGVYFYRIQTGETEETNRLTLLK